MFSTTSPPPNPRRVVTSHDANGKEYVWKDDALERTLVPGTKDEVTFCVPWITQGFPCDVQDESIDGKDIKIGELITDSGTTVRWVDMPPGHTSPMHRTISLDYGVLISGKINLIFPDGTETLISEPGSLCVQRGTAHAWGNPSDTEWCRMLFILIPSKKVVIDGKELESISIH